MPARMTIIRHAPTPYNAQDIFMGTLDVPVESFDEKKIKELKKLLSTEKYTAVYSSPLQRALMTAKKIVGTKNTIIIDDRLTERNLGDWQGLKKETIRNQYSGAFNNGIMDFYYTPKNGEHFKAMILRVSNFICNTYKQNGDILVFTHNGVFRIIKSLLTGSPLRKVFSKSEPFLVPQTFFLDNMVYLKIQESPLYTIDKNIKV